MKDTFKNVIVSFVISGLLILGVIGLSSLTSNNLKEGLCYEHDNNDKSISILATYSKSTKVTDDNVIYEFITYEDDTDNISVNTRSIDGFKKRYSKEIKCSIYEYHRSKIAKVEFTKLERKLNKQKLVDDDLIDFINTKDRMKAKCQRTVAKYLNGVSVIVDLDQETNKPHCHIDMPDGLGFTSTPDTLINDLVNYKYIELKKVGK